MDRQFLFVSFLLVLILCAELALVPPFPVWIAGLVMLIILNWSWLDLAIRQRRLEKTAKQGKLIYLKKRSFRPIGMIPIIITGVYWTVVVKDFMLIKDYLFKLIPIGDLMVIALFLMEKVPSMIWHFFPNKHILFLRPDYLYHADLYPHKIFFTELKEIVLQGEWKAQKGNILRFQATRFKGISLDLGDVKDKDLQEIKVYLSHLIDQKGIQISENLMLLKIDEIGQKQN